MKSVSKARNITQVSIQSFFALVLSLQACHTPSTTVLSSTQSITSTSPTPALPPDHVIIDSKTRTLTVYRDNTPIKVFDHVAFGSSGTKQKQTQGDSITPIGRFVFGSVRNSEKFRKFIPINYPSKDYVQNAYDNKQINKSTYDEMLCAIANGKTPRQDTILGGHLGIHGLGTSDLEIHRNINWTKGCIALDNDQIDALSVLISTGMVVEIR